MRMPGLGTCLVESDGQGEFRAEGLRSGRFLLSAYLMNSKIHAVRLESRWITVEEGSTTRVDFDMSGTAWLHGTVSFSEVVKLRNGIVVVWPNDILEPIPCGDEDFLTEHALAYASGEPKETTKSFEYDIPQLPEGVYKATAHWYTYEETEDGNREGMKNIRTVTRIVTLKAGESLKIDFDEKEALPCVEPEKEETRDS